MSHGKYDGYGKNKRIDKVRRELLKLIVSKFPEAKVQAKEITNTCESRAPFKYTFKLKDGIHEEYPKVSIGSISEKHFKMVMVPLDAGHIDVFLRENQRSVDEMSDDQRSVDEMSDDRYQDALETSETLEQHGASQERPSFT
ncbi:hypothetical protein H072_2641 [Dactylellina haptotyla CBS 200.50]|uniref:Uncharacterized protein n=1 Tax=Dactylellina haptotyla (strain CBS 200.50) TaxID=1284197 RepID=S8BV99_DACHA|nr:hypothetical protein H072_2641 [Dactylellina haptotyla CBS 200.50]